MFNYAETTQSLVGPLKSMAKNLDFDRVKLTEEERISQNGVPYLFLTIDGAFWGIEEGPDGSIMKYFESLVDRQMWIIVSLAAATNYSDLAPVIIRKVNNTLLKIGKGLILCDPID